MARKFSNLFANKKFHEYIFDFIVIVLSIWLSISIDRNIENKRNLVQEINTLESIQADMMADTASILAFIDWNNTVQIANSIFITGDTIGMHSDTIAYYFYILFQYNPYTITESGYEEMKQSGYSDLIENKIILRDIINHYSTFKGQFFTVNSIDKEVILNQIIPFVNQNFKGYISIDIDNREWRIGLDEIMNDFRFRNMVQSSFNLRYRTELLYEQYLENLRIIIANIDDEIERLQ